LISWHHHIEKKTLITIRSRFSSNFEQVWRRFRSSGAVVGTCSVSKSIQFRFYVVHGIIAKWLCHQSVTTPVTNKFFLFLCVYCTFRDLQEYEICSIHNNAVVARNVILSHIPSLFGNSNNPPPPPPPHTNN